MKFCQPLFSRENWAFHFKCTNLCLYVHEISRKWILANQFKLKWKKTISRVHEVRNLGLKFTSQTWNKEDKEKRNLLTSMEAWKLWRVHDFGMRGREFEETFLFLPIREWREEWKRWLNSNQNESKTWPLYFLLFK